VIVNDAEHVLAPIAGSNNPDTHCIDRIRRLNCHVYLSPFRERIQGEALKVPHASAENAELPGWEAKDMLVVEIEGGLGSQMFAYAAARRLALVHGVEVHIDTRNYRTYKKFNPELHHFQVDAVFLSHEQADEICGPNNERIRVVQPNHLHFDRSVLDIQDPNVLMRGNYVSEDYFFDITDVLRRDFTRVTQRSPYATQLNAELNLIRESGFQPVAVHVRRGDYVNEGHVNEIYGLVTLEYYNNAMTLVSKLVERPWFVFFSNDSDWIAQHFAGPNRTITRFPPESAPCEDMLSMAQCNHHILANSGYGWWGAWLGEKPNQVVVVPRPWLRDRSINTEDIPKRTWIGLGNLDRPTPHLHANAASLLDVRRTESRS
jgi:hypothetical protein